jgi:DNA-binding NarL/FixJ family response regulator
MDDRDKFTIKVLFIDPNDEERQKWAHRLKKCSKEYTVLHASTGRSGVNLVKSERVDCVVAELDLPDRNGLSVLIDLVGFAFKPQIAVVVLTTFPLDALRPLAIQNGAQSFMRKEESSGDDLDLAIRQAIAAVGPHKNRIA